MMLSPMEARAEAASATCEIYTVLATKTGEGTIPEDLGFLASQLRDDQFAAFKSFRLLESKTLKLKLGATGAATMASGHQLKLRLLDAEASKLKLHALLASDKRVLVDTDYRIESNGILLIGGVRHAGGKVFFAIRCRGG
ncbi:MAG TPA: hypothetical protein ENJ18_17165 [Nannocystis exedens]|nr:hypothetical protein [Nannocystis exedens]